METYIFLRGRQYNKWCSLKKFDFSNKTKKSEIEGVLKCLDEWLKYNKRKKLERW